jgi:Txe/YoeB family toxin of Txe-Axe toxin-antitoxin module
LIEQIYKTENFIKSKEVVFLDTITKTKLRPLEILEAFDKLKYNYDNNLQERIKCEDFSISSE